MKLPSLPHPLDLHTSPSPRARHHRRARGASLRPAMTSRERLILLATLTVDNPLDVHVANLTSLREAIVRANADAAAGTSDTIVFDSKLGSGTIHLDQGQL